MTERTVRAWIKRGCPCHRIRPRGKKGGRARIWLDPVKVRAWLAANDIETKGEEEKPPPTPKTIADPDLPKSGIIGAIARLRAMERVAYAAFLRSIKDKEAAGRVRAKERIYIEAHQALRRTEKEIPSILEKRGEMIPLETVLEEQSKLDLAVKNQFLTLPRKLAPQLATIADADEIEEILQNEIDDCLRHIASGDVLPEDASPDVQTA